MSSPTTIIEVQMTDDGHFTYRLRETPLNTKMYSQILLALAADIAEMMAIGSEGKISKEAAYEQIKGYMVDQMADEELLPETNLRMLQ